MSTTPDSDEKATEVSDAASTDSSLSRVRVWHFAACSMVSFLGVVLITAVIASTSSEPPYALLGLLAMACAVVGWVMWSVMVQGLHLRSVFGSVPTSRQVWIAIALAVSGLYLFGKGEWYVIVPLLERFAPTWADWYTMSSATSEPQELADQVLQFVSAVLLAPVIEEVLFRGLLYQRLAYAWGHARWALIASSGLFALVHGHFIGAFLFAVIATLLYQKTQSLWVSIIFHSILNGLAFFGSGEMRTELEVVVGGLGNYGFGLVCFAMSLLVLGGVYAHCRSSLTSDLPYHANRSATLSDDTISS